MVTWRPRAGGAGLILAAVLALACGGSAATPGPSVPPNTSGWWRDKTVYEVFVRSLADSDGDGIGDLNGLTARLPALGRCPGAAATNSLGVDALWLMPIFPSPSYHGYDVTNYVDVNPQYGALADFDALVAAAHACDLKIVLDMVLNHSSGLHPWFVDSSSGTGAAKRGWYVWSDTAASPGWSQPTGGAGTAWFWNNNAWYYAAFSYSMPDLNLANPAVEAELVTAMKFWLKRGVDGFRLDAVPYYVETGPGAGQVDQPGTHGFLKRVRAALQAEYPQTLLVAEVWKPAPTVATYYGAGDEVQLAFTFDLAAKLVSAAASGVGGDLMNAIDDAEAALGRHRPRLPGPLPHQPRSGPGDAPARRRRRGRPGGRRPPSSPWPARPSSTTARSSGMQGGAGRRRPGQADALPLGRRAAVAPASPPVHPGTAPRPPRRPATDLADAAGRPGLALEPLPLASSRCGARSRRSTTSASPGSPPLPASASSPVARAPELRRQADPLRGQLRRIPFWSLHRDPLEPCDRRAQHPSGRRARHAAALVNSTTLSFASLTPRGFAFVSLD